MSDRIIFEDVSKFYGEILGVNRVNLSIPPGITSLVGPNGSGKTTLMNLMTGLVRSSRGRVEVLGCPTNDPERLFKILGYSTQFDAFPKGLTGFQFIYSYLRLDGRDPRSAEQLAWRVIERVNLVEAAKRNIAGYSKGMRQRIRLAQALAHDPKVLVLDEPLNGLDPLARSEMIALFRAAAEQGCYVIISSHILHEVDVISDQVILLSNGYVVAEGQIATVRGEIQEHPTQILVRCTRPRAQWVTSCAASLTTFAPSCAASRSAPASRCWAKRSSPRRTSSSLSARSAASSASTTPRSSPPRWGAW